MGSSQPVSGSPRAPFAARQLKWNVAVINPRRLYQRAWDAHTDDYEACIAAHYVARFQESPEETLRWNQIALERANLVHDERVREFYPSLYLNMGKSHAALGYLAQAQKYFHLAAELGFVHQPE